MWVKLKRCVRTIASGDQLALLTPLGNDSMYVNNQYKTIHFTSTHSLISLFIQMPVRPIIRKYISLGNCEQQTVYTYTLHIYV